jgi:hypothetical protein
MTRVSRAVVLVLLTLVPQSLASQITVTEPAPGFHVLASPNANLVVFVDSVSAFVAGVHTPALVARAREVLTTLAAPATRYIVIMESDSAPSYGDLGWRGAGVTAIAQERLVGRMRRSRGPQPNDLPVEGFSQAVQIRLQREEAHIVHDYNGATDADVIVHFERSGFLILGALFTSDGYPDIKLDRGGTIDGMIRWVDWFCKSFRSTGPIVPARGPVSTLQGLIEYRDMLIAVRGRVDTLLKAGRSVEDVIAAKPAAEFDQRWGRGPVSSDRFVQTLSASLQKP